jgi:phosphoglycolate phosphatase-like HAD superfamily hydrolase
LREAASHIDKHTLVLFDLDNTLIEPAQTLGSDQWFSHRIHLHLKGGEDPHEAREKALQEWMAVQFLTDFRLVEEEAIPFLAELRERKIHHMGLTFRDMSLARRTSRELHRLGVSLAGGAPFPERVLAEANQAVLFLQGVLYTSGVGKADALFALLDRDGHRPKRIVLIDDKIHHLRDVEDACAARKIPFVGLRYGYLDEKVRMFPAEIADAQWKAFAQILSDEEALQQREKDGSAD